MRSLPVAILVAFALVLRGAMPVVGGGGSVTAVLCGGAPVTIALGAGRDGPPGGRSQDGCGCCCLSVAAPVPAVASLPAQPVAFARLRPALRRMAPATSHCGGSRWARAPPLS